jgi:hypothetical protein
MCQQSRVRSTEPVAPGAGIPQHTAEKLIYNPAWKGEGPRRNVWIFVKHSTKGVSQAFQITRVID